MANKDVAIRDAIISGIAKDMELPLELVDRVVSNQFKQANAAAKVHNEIEISGFGKFRISQSKIKRRLTKMYNVKGGLERMLTSADTQEKVIVYNKKLDNVAAYISFYESKVKG